MLANPAAPPARQDPTFSKADITLNTSPSTTRGTAANDNPRLMAPKDAAKATSLSRSLLTLMSEQGQFPKAVQLGTRRTAYVRAEVEAWIDERIAARAAV